MSPQHHWQEEFEDWYAALWRPVQLGPLLSDFVGNFCNGAADTDKSIMEAFDVVSARNDVKSLKKMAESLPGRHALHRVREHGDLQSIAWCVAHMLVDNSGHADFARAWIADAHPKPDGARALAHKLCQLGHRAEKDTQKILGLLEYTDFFKANETNPRQLEAPIRGLGGLNLDVHAQKQQCFTLAAVLRQNPDDRPVISVMTVARQAYNREFYQAFWSEDRSLAQLLPAIELAYATQSPEARLAVHQRMAQEARQFVTVSDRLVLPVDASDRADAAWWIALRRWGGDIGDAMLHSRHPGKGNMLDCLAKASLTAALPYLEQLQEQGADLDKNGSSGKRLLHTAVQAGNADLVGHLLALGCDAYAPARVKGWSDPKTPMDFALEGLKGAGASDPQRQLVLELLKTMHARDEAHKAIQELDLDLDTNTEVRP